MGYDSGYKPGKYEAVGWNVLLVNIICIVVTFVILFDDLLKAILVLIIQIVATAVTSMPFFYLEEVAKRVKSLELATYNQLYNSGIPTRIKHRDLGVSDEEFTALNFDDDTINNIKGKKCAKAFIDLEKWQCSCSRINQYSVGTCACGEKRPEYNKSDAWYVEAVEKELRNGRWICSCGRINQQYVGTCACGKRMLK